MQAGLELLLEVLQLQRVQVFIDFDLLLLLTHLGLQGAVDVVSKANRREGGAVLCQPQRRDARCVVVFVIEHEHNLRPLGPRPQPHRPLEDGVRAP